MQNKIIIKGAKQNNLKNINLEIPRGKITVFTGLSGSGKSSLAFDTIFAEGQRRYIESLSSYARQFLNKMDKPDVEEIEGLSPAISIDQKAHSSNPRSTVATITEIYDYLRVLFSRIGVPHCPHCGKKIQKMTISQIVDAVINFVKEEDKGKELYIMAPVIQGRKGEYYQMLYDLLNSGFSKVIIDGKFKSLRERIILEKYKQHNIDLITDEFSTSIDFENKENRLRLNDAIETALKYGQDLVKIIIKNKKEIKEVTFSTKLSCPKDNFSYPSIEPRLFSFNSPYGACEECHGLGVENRFSSKICKYCLGKRLKKEALSILIKDINISEVTSLSISEALFFFSSLEKNLNEKDLEISKTSLQEIKSRLKFLIDVGLDYLTLDRRSGTLSGGEAQRIRLASQIGSKLVGTLYILDEPTIGLHQRDNEKLIKTLKELKNLGNTIIIVEHDEDTIFSSDYLVDFGKGAGIHGGEVVASGNFKDLLKDSSKKSLTLDYLRGDKKIKIPDKRRQIKKNTPFLKLRGVKQNNLKNINVDIPLSKFVAITGVSGSGKSTLIYDVLYKELSNRFYHAKHKPGKCNAILGTEYIDKIINIDQSSIGRTPRSNPATYIGVWASIRELFASTAESRFRGWKPGRFSFNVPGGRCENCDGHGQNAIEMHFLPTIYVTCEVCGGKRFDRETLEIEYNGKNIYDILCMTAEEALDFFKDIPWIKEKIKILNDVGLGYLKLGQSATTLSGGEAQRIKLSAELGKRDTHKTLYLLDEPTIGLHYEDVKNLLIVLQTLVNRGNTIVVIEHNLDVIKSADWVIDLGPEGGENGGEIIAKGTPEEIKSCGKSHTARYLRKIL